MKKRSINELRQVKDAVYKRPQSHFKRLEESKTVRFTQEDLHSFSAELLKDVLGVSSISIDVDIIDKHVRSYFE
tara:strand:- start:803 stop:1024 length:222 start_codon:yes stop_codon:yes gene_type:complete